MKLSNTSLVVVLVCLLIAGASTIGVAQAQLQEDEPNDDNGAATPLEDDETSGEIEVTGDEDWYEFDVEEGDSISLVYTGGTPNGILSVDLVGPDEETIDDAYLESEGGRAQITATAEQTGTYYTKVSFTGFADLDEPAAYTVTKESPETKELETATPTATATATPTATSTPTPTATTTVVKSTTQSSTGMDDGTNGTAVNQSTTGNQSDGSSTSGPGFGVLSAVVALLALVFIGVRQR